MNPLQKTIYLATTDAEFRLALQTDGAAVPSTSLGASLTRHGLALSPEEMGALRDLKELLTLPATSLADRVQKALSPTVRKWGG